MSRWYIVTCCIILLRYYNLLFVNNEDTHPAPRNLEHVIFAPPPQILQEIVGTGLCTSSHHPQIDRSLLRIGNMKLTTQTRGMICLNEGNILWDLFLVVMYTWLGALLHPYPIYDQTNWWKERKMVFYKTWKRWERRMIVFVKFEKNGGEWHATVPETKWGWAKERIRMLGLRKLKEVERTRLIQSEGVRGDEHEGDELARRNWSSIKRENGCGGL